MFILIIKDRLTILVYLRICWIWIGIGQWIIAMFRLVQFWSIGIMNRCRFDSFFLNISFCREVSKGFRLVKTWFSFLGFKII